MTSLDVIRPWAQEARSGFPKSVMNCGTINANIQLALEQEEDITSELLQCTVTGIHGGKAPHMYLRIPAGELDDTNTPVIVDGALDQFTDANLNAGTVKASIHSDDHEDAIPAIVIATPANPLYGYYNGANPVR